MCACPVRAASTSRGACGVIFVTAFSDEGLLREAAAAGGYAYILKPVKERDLLAAVRLSASRAAEFRATADALQTRRLVDRAKQTLKDALGVNDEDAARLLRLRSRHSRRPLRDVAREILAADEAFRSRRRGSRDRARASETGP